MNATPKVHRPGDGVVHNQEIPWSREARDAARRNHP
jgi:hypothetical protein